MFFVQARKKERGKKSEAPAIYGALTFGFKATALITLQAKKQIIKFFFSPFAEKVHYKMATGFVSVSFSLPIFFHKMEFSRLSDMRTFHV